MFSTLRGCRKTTQFRHSEAIEQGTPLIQEALSEAGIDSIDSEDFEGFTDEGLKEYDALVMFQTSGDPRDAAQKAALERYQKAGGGIVAIHNATDMRGNYACWDNLIGALMSGHADTGSSPGLPGTLRIEDQVHPSTKHSPQRWERADEWYNILGQRAGRSPCPRHKYSRLPRQRRHHAGDCPPRQRPRLRAGQAALGRLMDLPGFTASDVSAASTNTRPTSLKAWSASPAR
ncbi:ThuA domain-containing protein [Micromonospora sp. WMMC250]|uniref:ThuA domain-containing protein n=1 Tax=Micromonospora sp. WMMC250 TaxID=3014781 RepID=UPI003FA5954F